MGVLNAAEVEKLYDRRADIYDLLNGAFRTLGFRRHQERVISELNLREGNTVVDLCCGTGVNLKKLSSAVGPEGTVIGVDLSQGMLAKAKDRSRSAGLENVQLVRADARDYELPDGTAAVLSTFGLEMVPDYAQVIESCANRLPAGGRLALLGLKHPESWPDWMMAAGVAATKAFGVSRDYEDFRPWLAADRYFERRSFCSHLADAAYSYCGEKVHDINSLRVH